MPVEVDEILRCAVASYYSETALARWQNLGNNSELNWKQLADYAANLGLAPLLYEAVKKIDANLIPPGILAQLSKIYFETAGHNLLVLQEVEALQERFRQDAVEAVVLKGAALILDVYDEPAQRPMVDIDLLFQFENLERVKELLGERGYRELNPHPFHDRGGLVWNEEILVHEREKKPVIELHWHLLDNPYYATRLETKNLITRSRIALETKANVRVLNIEDQFLHLCCHNLYHHMGEFTRSLVDLAFVVSSLGQQLSWDEIMLRAEQSDLRLAVSTAVIQLADFWYAAVPSHILARVTSWKPSRKERFYAWCQHSGFFRALRTFITLPGVQYKFSYLKGQMFPDREYLMWRYGLSEDSSLLTGYFTRYTSAIMKTGRAALRRSE